MINLDQHGLVHIASRKPGFLRSDNAVRFYRTWLKIEWSLVGYKSKPWANPVAWTINNLMKINIDQQRV